MIGEGEQETGGGDVSGGGGGGVLMEAAVVAPAPVPLDARELVDGDCDGEPAMEDDAEMKSGVVAVELLKPPPLAEATLSGPPATVPDGAAELAEVTTTDGGFRGSSDVFATAAPAAPVDEAPEDAAAAATTAAALICRCERGVNDAKLAAEPNDGARIADA